MIIDEILKRGKLKSMSVETGVGSTGEAHLATLEGKKYLLRICKDEETANKYIGYYNKFKKHGFFPKLLESTGKYVLFEFIEGRRCSENESLRVIRRIGRIAAQINKAKADYDYQKSGRFFKKLEEIRQKKFIPEDLAIKAIGLYNLLNKKIKLKYALDAGDMTNDNFMISKKGKVYFVDIEAIKPNIKGYGIAKGFSSWFKDDKDKEYFTKGYNSAGSMNFFTEDYMKLVTLIFFIDRIRFKSIKGEMNIVKITISKLNKLLSNY